MQLSCTHVLPTANVFCSALLIDMRDLVASLDGNTKSMSDDLSSIRADIESGKLSASISECKVFFYFR